MHAAPPVRIDLAPDRTAGWLVLGLGAVAAANAAVWAAAMAGGEGAALGAAGGAAALVVLACLRGRPLGSAGQLSWDGGCWVWAPAAQQPVVPRVMLDFGGWILLRLQRQDGLGPAVWGVATRQRTSTGWSVARAALFSAAPAQQGLPPA